MANIWFKLAENKTFVQISVFLGNGTGHPSLLRCRCYRGNYYFCSMKPSLFLRELAPKEGCTNWFKTVCEAKGVTLDVIKRGFNYIKCWNQKKISPCSKNCFLCYKNSNGTSRFVFCLFLSYMTWLVAMSTAIYTKIR